MLFTGLIIGLLGYCIWASGRVVFRVDQGYLGVLTSFGAAVTEPDDPKRLRTFGPGLHFKWPWQKVQRVSMMEQNLDLAGDKGGRTAMAEDGTVLRFDSILRFVPVESELANFLFDLKKPLEHITGLFTCLLRNEIANFSPIGLTTNGQNHALLPSSLIPSSSNTLSASSTPSEGGSYAVIRRDRKQLNAKIEEFCQKEIGKRYGVQFSAVDLTDILPPDELADALNAVMNAQTEADGLYARAEAENQQRIVAARRGVEIAKARALAAEREIHTLAEFLRDMDHQGTLSLYVARRRAEVLSQSRAFFLRSAS